MHRSLFKTECKHNILVQYEVVSNYFFDKIPFLLSNTVNYSPRHGDRKQISPWMKSIFNQKP